MNIDKSQIIDLLKSQGHNKKAERAEGELPDKVDTDNDEYKNLLAKFGIDPSELLSKFGGGLPGGLGNKLGGL